MIDTPLAPVGNSNAKSEETAERDYTVQIGIAAESENRTRTRVDAGDHELVIDEPEMRRGTDDGPTPLATMIAAQAGCLDVTGHKVADDMGVEIESLSIDIEGDYRPARLFDDPSEVRAGFDRLRVSIDVELDDAVEEWASRTEVECPVTDNIIYETPCEVTVDHS